jgi:hypothetical protein
MLVYAGYYKNSGFIPVTFRQCLRLYHTIHPYDCILSMYFANLDRRTCVYSKGSIHRRTCFTRAGITNIHRKYVTLGGSPHAVRSLHLQEQFSVSLWARMRSRDSSFGIVTGYGLDDQEEREFESR